MARIGVAVILLMCLCCVVWGGCPHSRWKYRSGYCYQMFHSEMTREKAEASCRGKSSNHYRPSHLTSIHSHDENEFIRTQVTHNTTAWIGFKDTGVKDGWFQWSDESYTKFIHWLDGQPDDMHDGQEDCAVINYYDSEDPSPIGGYWGDEKCQSGDYPYVCKMKAL